MDQCLLWSKLHTDFIELTLLTDHVNSSINVHLLRPHILASVLMGTYLGLIVSIVIPLLLICYVLSNVFYDELVLL